MPKAKTMFNKYFDRRVILSGLLVGFLMIILAPVYSSWAAKGKSFVDKMSPTTGGGIGTPGGEIEGEAGDY